MKQYIVINNDLGMSKGKVARICHSAGVFHKRLSTFWQRVQWYKNMTTTVVLKANKEEFEKLINSLDYNNIKHLEHIDAGKTQVEKDSVCMTTFFSSNGSFTMKLKLY